MLRAPSQHKLHVASEQHDRVRQCDSQPSLHAEPCCCPAAPLPTRSKGGYFKMDAQEGTGATTISAWLTLAAISFCFHWSER